jgi:1-deoxy-D-xylulose-5-phosphate synthase
MTEIELGKARSIREGSKVAILNFGTLYPEALKAAEELDATLIDMRFVKPMDEQAVLKAAKNHELLVTLEDGAISGGAGSAVQEVLHQHKVLAHTLLLGLPDEFVMQGTQQEMYAELGIDAAGIVKAIQEFF